MIPLRASASSRPCTLTSSVYAVRDVTLSEPPPPFLPSVIRGYLIRQSRTHSRRGGREGGRERGRAQSIRSRGCYAEGTEEHQTQPKEGRRLSDNGEREDAAFILYFVGGIGRSRRPRDRSLGITNEECTEHTYIIEHIYTNRVCTCLCDRERERGRERERE